MTATRPEALARVAACVREEAYTGLEKVFSEVSPELNGESLASETWHRDLLHAVTLDLPGFRPSVIRADLESRLLELLKFHHLYRNLYSFDLR
jgi:HepT-like protein